MNDTPDPNASNGGEASQPTVEVRHAGGLITLLGTAHVSRASADKVRELLASGKFDSVAVELCPSRYNAVIDPDALARMDLFKVFREGKAMMVTASLALGAYQQRLAEQFGIRPGEEMRVAIELANEAGLPVRLIDREIGVTLKRVYRNVPWWRRFALLSGLLASVISQEEVSEEEIERLKEGDILETTFGQFADQARELYDPLIAERDRYMAAGLEAALSDKQGHRILAVVGAGHLKGIEAELERGVKDPRAVSESLDRVPTGAHWPRYIPWVIVALILIGFGIGFSRSPDLGWRLVLDWVLINGGLSALGALVAAAHPLTVVTAFLAAPLTSLNPTIGAGMVTTATEIYLRKPQVGDFARLREDTAHFAGWRKNRVARTLLVFLLSTLGSAIGTYVAGFRIFGRLTGG